MIILVGWFCTFVMLKFTTSKVSKIPKLWMKSWRSFHIWLTDFNIEHFRGSLNRVHLEPAQVIFVHMGLVKNFLFTLFGDRFHADITICNTTWTHQFWLGSSQAEVIGADYSVTMLSHLSGIVFRATSTLLRIVRATTPPSSRVLNSLPALLGRWGPNCLDHTHQGQDISHQYC